LVRDEAGEEEAEGKGGWRTASASGSASSDDDEDEDQADGREDKYDTAAKRPTPPLQLKAMIDFNLFQQISTDFK
jgi:hypothetical protein